MATQKNSQRKLTLNKQTVRTLSSINLSDVRGASGDDGPTILCSFGCYTLAQTCTC